MASLARELRRDLASKVTSARRTAEEGARKAIEGLAVNNPAPWESMTAEERKFRNRLRAHGRQLGDQRDAKGAQTIGRLVSEVAYEHWHGMLFARFLAENELLLMPGTTTAISLDEIEEIARDEKRDWLAVVSEYAEKMLPQIFRSGDPTLEVVLPRETRSELEKIVRELDDGVFTATDSLGWVYQFWQADRKDEVNASGNKVGADELAAVTQLFTEDYMVDFLLDNTLGAWHAGKVLAANPSFADSAKSEEEVRWAVALPGCPWTYLRFVQKDGRWAPAAGTFDAWPKTADLLRCLDPCMGSGHFVVALFERLVALRLAEGGQDETTEVQAVISENLYGLEIDPRCTQIAAFNLALAAWRRVGHCSLPSMNLACSGLSPNAKREDWLQLAGGDDRLQRGMSRLHALFKNAPALGSLTDPTAAGGDLIDANFHELQPLLKQALARETVDVDVLEMAVAADGLAKAAEILGGHYTLIATNVPYLGRGKQDDVLKDYCARFHPAAKGDLATCFVERCVEFCASGASVALVTPQNWWFLGSYKSVRERLLTEASLNFIVTLGEEAWQSFGDRGPVAALMIAQTSTPANDHTMAVLDALPESTIEKKSNLMREGAISQLTQRGQHANPDHRITVESSTDGPLLQVYARSFQGVSPADFPHYGRSFWEVVPGPKWKFWQSTVEETTPYGGRSLVLWWNEDLEAAIGRGQAFVRGEQAWGKWGVAVRQMRNLSCTLYAGEVFDTNTAIIVPHDQSHLAAVWEFCSSAEFKKAIRRIDMKVNVTNASFLKVPFDIAHWQAIADTNLPNGLPKPASNDPTQWLFNGHPKEASCPLQVGVARLLGYKWPRQTGVKFLDCAAVDNDGLEKFADEDGIVCLSSGRGEPPAHQRLRELLAEAWDKKWNAAVLEGLLASVGFAGQTLDDWLRNGFFDQHLSIFGSSPFVWHVWDGRRDGFNALINYQRLAGPNGEALRTLDKLIYTYLGSWIEKQQLDQEGNIDGADGRLAAAQHLKNELEKIRKGDLPFDIFVRWKALSNQPVGWNPDINDGVRINIRPFMTARPLGAKAKNACILRTPPRISWDKDRGTEPEMPKLDFPWFWKWDGSSVDFSGDGKFDGVRWNDLHYSLSAKRAATKKDAA